MTTLHVATWHAGPHLTHDECLFVNLENLATICRRTPISAVNLQNARRHDAVASHFIDATLASTFVARWCAGYKVETAEGVFGITDRCTDPAGCSPPAPDI